MVLLSVNEAVVASSLEVAKYMFYSLPVRGSRVVHKMGNLSNSKSYVGMGPNGGVHEGSDGFMIGVSGHLADVGGSSRAVVTGQHGICNDEEPLHSLKFQPQL